MNNKAITRKENILVKAIPALLFLVLFSFSVIAIPNSINIQGKLTNTNNQIQTGTFNFTFKIYDSYTGGTALYEKANLTETTDSRGIYDIILTDVNVNFDKQLFLGIEVNSDGEMSPRINFTSVPYSFKANESYGLNTSKDATINNNINLTALGNINAAGTISAETLNAVSSLNVGGGFSLGGLTIQSDGNIITQGDILFTGNISIVNVTHLSVNGSILPALDATFDIGNSFFRWKNANFSGSLEAGSLISLGNLNVDSGALFVDSSLGNVGINTTV